MKIAVKNSGYLSIVLLVALSVGCTKMNKKVDTSLLNSIKPQSAMSHYTSEAALEIYGYQPVRALQIIDSAVIVGNLSQVRADIFRAKIYSATLMTVQTDSLLGGPKGISLDSAKSICEHLLTHDSIKNNVRLQYDVMENLVHTARMQDDTLGWMQRSRELIDVCHQIGEDAEADALRTEAELGAALYTSGQQELGMAKLDSVISLLENSLEGDDMKKSFSRLDALIIALKRKIILFSRQDLDAETLPLARQIIERLDDYEQHPDAYHDGSHREPQNDTKREDYIRFYRSQAQNFITAAYSSLGEHGNMIEAFNKIELAVRDITAREHIARYNALQQQMEAERQHAIIARANLTILSLVILALSFFAFAIVFIVKNRSINRKNHLLAMKIADAIKYKKMYLEEKRAQAPLSVPDLDTVSDEQLFQYINEVILRERLFLDPKFERQTVMDRFQLTKERVGAVFSKGSDHAKLTSYIQQLRLEYAAKLLAEQPDKNIVQIAAESGFSTSTYFSDRFRQHFGLSPTYYRKNTLTNNDDSITP